MPTKYTTPSASGSSRRSTRTPFEKLIVRNMFDNELIRSGLQAEKEKKIEVFYNDKVIGDYMADIIVENKVILELKSVKTPPRDEVPL